MYKQNVSNTHFSYGEISPYLFGRGDIDAYKNSAMTILNMDVIPTGGVKRRGGFKYLATLPSDGKLINFDYSSSENFLLYFSEKILWIYNSDGEKIVSLVTPFSLEQLSNIRWAQKGNQLYIVHDDVPPKVLKYYPLLDSWLLEDWQYALNDRGFSCEPFVRFPDTENVDIIPSDVVGEITLISSQKLFDKSFIGVKLLVNGGEVYITKIISSTEAIAMVRVELSSVDTASTWLEQAFSFRRGFPKSIAFHQNRLVLGGSKSLANRLWFSKTGEYFNFDLAEGLDDEAIEFDLVSDKVNEIVSVFSGKHLQIFTSDSEWMVSGFPLTPTSLVVKQQTKIGSVADKFISPKLVEGSTIFVAKNNKEIREFFYGDISENYSSEDLILLSNHLMNKPKELDYDVKNRKLYVLQSDGSIAVLLTNKTNGINAWFKYNTCGEFISLNVFNDTLYVIVKRDDKYFLEYLCDEVMTDSSLSFSFTTKCDKIFSISHLNNKVVSVNADNYIFDIKVEDNQIVLPVPAKNIFLGVPYTHTLCPLPVLVNWQIPPKFLRLFDLTFRVMDTPLLQVDTGDGIRNFSCLDFNRKSLVDNSLEPFNGDIHIKAKGLIKNFEVPLWKVQSSKPYNVKILSVSAKVGSVK